MPMTSAPEWLSRLPVGSSARISGGFGDERPGDRHALLLAAGELGRLVAGPVAEAQPLEHVPGRVRAGRAGETPWYRSGVATFSSAVVRGSRLYDWKMKPMDRLRIAASPSSSSSATRSPDERVPRPTWADPGSR